MPDVTSPPRGGAKASRAHRLRGRVALGLLAPPLTALGLALAPAGAQAATTGTISGSFTVPAGTVSPSDVSVLLADRNGNEVAISAADETVTAAGTYTITGVAPGQYYVYFHDTTTGDNVAPDYYGDGGSDTISKATVVTVPVTGGTQSLGAETLAAGATISGTVSDANSAGETSSRVIAEPSPAAEVSDPLLADSSAAVTSGAYKISGLPAGTYTLRYRAAGSGLSLTDVYVDGSGLTYDFGSASQYAVTAGGSATAAFSVPALGGIAGTVTDASGNPLSGVGVSVFDAAGTAIPAAATTAVDGTYAVTGVLPGSYEVEFDGLAGSNIASTFFGGSSFATASKVAVTSGVLTPAINGSLGAGATVSGTVTAAQGGALLGGLPVELIDAQGNVVAATTTNPDGTYTLSDVPAGTWYLEFIGGRAYNGDYYQTEYYLGESTLGGSLPVNLAAGQTMTGVNESLMSESTTAPGLPKVSLGKFSGLSTNKVALSFRLTAGSGPAGYLLGFTVKLPKNISWNKAALKRDIVIPHDKYTEAIKSGRLVITFTTGKKVVNFRIKAGGIKVTRKIETEAKQRRIASEGIALVVADTTGKLSAGSFTVKKPH